MEYLKTSVRRGLPFIIGLALIAVAVFTLAPNFINRMALNGGAPRDRMTQQAGNTTRSADARGGQNAPNQQGANQQDARGGQNTPNQQGANQQDARGGQNTPNQQGANQQDARGGQNTPNQQGANQQGANQQGARGGQSSARSQDQQGARGGRPMGQNNAGGERRGGPAGGGLWRWLIGSPLQWAGIALIGAGLWLLGRRRTPPPPPTTPSEPIHPETQQPPQAA